MGDDGLSHYLIRSVAACVGSVFIVLWLVLPGNQAPAQQINSGAVFGGLDVGHVLKCATPERQDADLCQQWRMAVAAEESAKFARYGFWIVGFGSLLFLAVTSLFAGQAAVWAKRAALAAERTWQSSERPWLSADIDIHSITISDAEFYVEFQCRIKNIGSSPAADIQLRTFITTNGFETDRLLTSLEPAIRTWNNFGFALFPNQTINDVMHIHREYILRDKLPAAAREKNWFLPTIVVVVDYSSPNHGTLHMTTVCKLIGLKTQNPKVSMAFEWLPQSLGPDDVCVDTRMAGNRVT